METKKNEVNEILKETQANIAKQVEARVVALREETNKKIETVLEKQESTFKR